MPTEGQDPASRPRRTMGAILGRHQNGAGWRSIPTELGPWRRAAQVFVRWARPGVRERHQWARSPEGGGCDAKGGSAPERGRREALGRPRGGHRTKARVIADGQGRAAAFRQHVWEAGARPATPTRRDEVTAAYPDWFHNDRDVVERLWARVEQWRQWPPATMRPPPASWAWSASPPPSTGSRDDRP